MKSRRLNGRIFNTAMTALWLVATAVWCSAATFTNNASLVVSSDPASSLTSTNGTFTVACWFKLNVPSSLSLNENMMLFMDRADGNESAPHSFHLRVNAASGALEFVTLGAGGGLTNKIMDGLFVGRWYHVAVSRLGAAFNFYVDGRSVGSAGAVVGSTTGSGLCVGGYNGTSRLFYGDIVEFSIHKAYLQLQDIRYMMFSDQRSSPNPANLKAYYKLGYLTNGVENFTNYVTSPPPGTALLTKVGPGNITFPEVDQSGEQSLFDSRVNGGQNAISPLSGMFSWQDSALSRPTPGIGFDFRFTFSGALPPPPSEGDDPYDRRSLGIGWRHSFDSRVTKDILPAGGSEIRILSWDGSVEAWTQTNLAQPFRTRHGEYRGELRELPDFQVEWTTPERLVYRFNAPGSTALAGRLTEVRDPFANHLTLNWDPNALLTNVTDTAGGQYVFNYNTAILNLLTNVSFGSWQVNFTYDATNRLASQSFTNTSGAYSNVPTTTLFFYTNVMGFTLLDRIVDPRGFTNTVVTYDKYRRKIRIADSLNRATTYEYGVPDSRTIRMTDPENYQHLTTYDRKGRVISETDPLGNTTGYTYSDAGYRTSVTEPLGYVTRFDYDSRGNMTARTNVLGEVTRWTFHTNFNRATSEINPLGWTTYFKLDDVTGNLLSQYDGLGLIVTNVYAINGLLLASTDGRGFTSAFDYDANGFMIRKTDAANATNRYAYNELGWKLSETNALGQSASYAYDLNGHVVRTVDPLLRIFTSTYDAAGNLLSASDAKGALTSYAYDPANQKTNMVDRTGTNVWRYYYSARGNLTNTVNSVGVGTTNFYDAVNRLSAVAAPLGNVITNQYDAQGRLTNIVDQLGRSWRKTYDQLNRVIVETDPQGDSKLTEYDSLGRVKRTTSPNGWASVNEYDARGRLHRWTDPEGFKWDYDYDANANITNITDAIGGLYVMAYGPRNERTLERNQDGKQWTYVYDLLGRLKQQTDPNGTTRTLDYDDGGRVLSVTFNTGRVNSFAYDDNNNPEVLSRSGSGPATLSQLRYDVMDRVIEYTDAFSKKIKYQYDALGRRSVLTYPDGKTLAYQYDTLNRLTNQVDWAGRQLTYFYDQASRLVRRTYPNGVVQTNAFDESGQLTSLTYSLTNALPPTNAINVALRYAYDRNGNKVGGSQQGTLDWPIPANRTEKADYTPAGRLTERQITMAVSTNPQPAKITYGYDASGNLTNAAGNGQSWALAYDEDNRTMRIAWDCGITHKDITNRYDVMGRRIAKSVDSIETRYALDLAAGMERILCDLAPNGQITAYYIHGPDLSYKVTPGATEAVTCYHADAQANIIAVTGTGGTNLSQYAYTPYGRSLGSTNCDPSTLISQPYTFVGSQGVMEELPGLYFMRARYYSADCGMFLSTDSVKNIGPGWQTVAYTYADSNPLRRIDPEGRFAWVALWKVIQAVDAAFEVADLAVAIIDYKFRVETRQMTEAERMEQIALDAIDAIPGDGAIEIIQKSLEVREAKQQGSILPLIPISGPVSSIMGHLQRIGETMYSLKHPAKPDQKVDRTTAVQSTGDASVPQEQSSVSAACYATTVNQQSTSDGTTGATQGAAQITPLDLKNYYSGKADTARARAANFSAKAGYYHGVYQQNMARYNELKASFANTDYFNYWIMANQAKTMADQAYSQYRQYQRWAEKASSQARFYNYAAKNSN